MIKTYISQIIARIISVKSNPYISPWIFFICLVERLHLRLDQEAAAFFQVVFFFPYTIQSLSFQYIMDKIIRADGRAEAVCGLALCIAAIAEVHIRKFSV